jgi:AraC family transcriptional activator of pobA
MSATEPHRIKTISDFHMLVGLPRPEHPLISVINLEDVKQLTERTPGKMVLDFYTITVKRHYRSRFKYGQQQYDVKEGVMYFIAPGQVYEPSTKIEEGADMAKLSGWGLYIHPDFLWNTP